MLFTKIVKWIKSLCKINNVKQKMPKGEIVSTIANEEAASEKIEKEYTTEDTSEHQKRIQQIGEAGERTSNFKTLPIVVYGKQLRNLYIPTRNNETTEIDTVIISVSGIYVIETKNYSGKIYGYEEQTNWTAWYSDNKKFSFYNPIKQNQTHLNALKANLDEVSEECFFSIIVFGNNSDIQKIQYNKTQNQIINQKNLLDKFKEILMANEGKLSRQEVNEIFEKLKKFANADNETKEKHISYVNSRKAINKGWPKSR